VSESPARIGRYQIRRELGRGMMGVVYEAHDSVLQRIVALKTIHLAFDVSEADRKSFEERFLTEARSAARLSHPGIVVVHDVGRDPQTGTLFMALEHLKGRPLSALYGADAPMPWREALRVVSGVAEALHHAHAAGVVHRDIKPANIMVLDSGDPKVMDFGLAKLQASQLHLTSSGQFFGTPLYMSPEQALGQSLDGRSDLFSLGAVTYAILTGRSPFSGDNIPQIFLKVANESPSPPSALKPELPPGVDDLIARAMAKTPEARYPDGRSMARDVEEILAGRIPQRQTAVAAGVRKAQPAETVATPAPAAPPLPGPPTRLGAPARGRSARPPAAPPPGRSPRHGPPGRGRPNVWLLSGVGLAILIAGLFLGTRLRARRAAAGTTPPPSSAPAGRLTEPPSEPSRAEAAEPRSDPEESLALPVPTTLASREAELLAQAMAARLSGELERSRELLQELLDSGESFPAASRLLERVEAEIWARDTLPIHVFAEHNHRIGSCRGELTLEPTGLAFRSRDHGQWQWSFADIQVVRRKGLREMELVTNETEALRLGGAKRYDFKLLGELPDREVLARFLELVRTR
jgi:tRNA A-37 threonylcarbamoyl transferase component Bud32